MFILNAYKSSQRDFKEYISFISSVIVCFIQERPLKKYWHIFNRISYVYCQS